MDKASSTFTAKEFADSHHMAYLETSAKTNANVTPAFHTLASVLKQKIDEETGAERQRGQTANLEDSVYHGTNRRTTLGGYDERKKKEVNCCNIT